MTIFGQNQQRERDERISKNTPQITTCLQRITCLFFSIFFVPPIYLINNQNQTHTKNENNTEAYLLIYKIC